MSEIYSGLFRTILDNGHYLVFLRTLEPKLGTIATRLLSGLIDKQNYYHGKRKLKKDGSFYVAKKDFIKETKLSRYHIDKALEILEENGLITVRQVKGNANYFFLKTDRILDFLRGNINESIN